MASAPPSSRPPVVAGCLPDLGPASLRLLHREPPAAPVLAAGMWRESSLTADLAAACDPAQPLDDGLWLNILLKLLHALAHPGSQDQVLDEAELIACCGRFAARRCGCAGLEGQGELRRRLLDLGFALTMLADLPRTLAVVRTVAAAEVLPAHEEGQVFRGLDIGAGSGVLMLAMAVLARRKGYAHLEITGLERHPRVSQEASRLMAALSIGEVIRADAKDPTVYAALRGKPLHMVCNETLPSQGRPLWKEDFPAICQVLFAELGAELAGCAFFPAALEARDRSGSGVLMTPADRFQGPGGPGHKPARLLRAHAIPVVEADGRLALRPLGEVGREFADLVHPAWRECLGRRW